MVDKKYNSDLLILCIQRIAAGIIDYIPFSIVCIILNIVFISIPAGEMYYERNPNNILIDVIDLFIYLIYYIVMESSSKQANLGKISMGIKVTDMEGNRPGVMKCIIRNLMKIVTILTLGVGYLVMLTTKNNQTLHDMPAKCRVVSNKN